MIVRRQFLTGCLSLGFANSVGSLSALAQAPARSPKRIALVIGVQNYEAASGLPVLKAPLNDARAVAERLEATLRIKPMLVLDPTFKTLRQKIAEFAAAVADADVAIVYYAGHGIQATRAGAIAAQFFASTDFENPAKNATNPQEATEAFERAIVENRVLGLSMIERSIKSARKIGLVFWDACRNNPYYTTPVSLRADPAQLAQASGTRAIPSVEFGAPAPQGNAPVVRTRLTTPEGVIIHNATQPGRTADDVLNAGDKHSPYATALLEHLCKPGIGIYSTLSDIAKDVMDATQGKQEPRTEGGLLGGDVILVPTPTTPSQTTTKSSSSSGAARAAQRPSGGSGSGTVSGQSSTARMPNGQQIQIETKSTTMFQ